MLAKLKILDFTTLLPGPYATMILADLGADVISIQKPDQQILFEGFESFNAMLSRNKSTLSLNLKENKSIEKIKSLVSEYDIIIEGFRPGVMRKFGLDYESLKLDNDQIIYCSISGYGQTGKYSKRAGHDINFLALTGIASYSGAQTTGPDLPGIQIADLTSSMYAVISILAANTQRQETGKGQYIDLSMNDCIFSLGILQGLNFLHQGVIPTYKDSFLTGSSYYGYYRTKDNRYLSIGSIEPKFFTTLCKALEINPTADFNLLKKKLAEKIEKRSLREWMEIFTPLDICVEPVLNLDEAINQDYFKNRNNVVIVEGTEKLHSKQIAHPVKFSEYSPKYKASKRKE